MRTARTARPVWRVLRQLFHQMIGAVFLCLAAFGALAALHQWHNPAAHWVAWLGIGYAAMMAAFGVGAFRASRRVR